MGLLTLAGATLGVLYLRRNWGLLTGTRVDVRPVVLVSGRAGVLGRVRF